MRCLCSLHFFSYFKLEIALAIPAHKNGKITKKSILRTMVNITSFFCLNNDKFSSVHCEIIC